VRYYLLEIVLDSKCLCAVHFHEYSYHALSCVSITRLVLGLGEDQLHGIILKTRLILHLGERSRPRYYIKKKLNSSPDQLQTSFSHLYLLLKKIVSFFCGTALSFRPNDETSNFIMFATCSQISTCLCTTHKMKRRQMYK
jgi:hypothetical protein